MHRAMLSASAISLRTALHLPLWGASRGCVVSIAMVFALWLNAMSCILRLLPPHLCAARPRHNYRQDHIPQSYCYCVGYSCLHCDTFSILPRNMSLYASIVDAPLFLPDEYWTWEHGKEGVENVWRGV